LTLQAAYDRRGKVLGKFAKVISILVALAMVIGVFAVFSPTSTAEMSETPRYANPVAIDLGPAIRNAPVNMKAIDAMMSEAQPSLDIFGAYYDVNDTMEFYDSYGGNFLDIEKMGEGDHCEVWVATDLSFPEGDLRNNEPWNLTITQADVDYMIEQFDEVIYPNETEFFGPSANLTGDNALFKDWGFDYPQNENGTKTMIVIENIIDDNYFNPNYPYYVVGYFSPSSKAYYDRNLIHIDCWDWANRTRDSGDRPFLYEGTVAHEYQHLLHDTYDADEDLWLNEGLSMYAEFLCGYSDVWDSIYRFLYSPDNSLIDWEDQGGINVLADYGNGMLFMMYLNDHFGGADFISALFNCPLNGIEAVNACLAESEYPDWTFLDAFKAFRLANLIHSDSVGDGWYNYESINWSDPEAMELYDGNFRSYHMWNGVVDASDFFGHTYTYDIDDETGMRYDTRMSDVGAYGTDYFWMTPYEAAEYLGLKYFFDGDEEVAEGWTQTPKNVLYTEDFTDCDDFDEAGWTTYGGWEIAEWSGGEDAAWSNSTESSSFYRQLFMETESFDTVDYESLELEFYIDYVSYMDQLMVALTYDDAPYWYVKEYITESQKGTVTVDISDYANKTGVKLMFIYQGDRLATISPHTYVLIDDISVYDPTDMCWYSGAKDWIDYCLVGSADLTDVENATLVFDTYYDIEDYWDFGFVQVSTDDGETWTSLANDYTTDETDPDARPLIVENVPGLTGWSEDWMTMEFDLSAYDGQEIMFQFRYITDWSAVYEGWFIDNVYVAGELVDNADDVVGLEPVFPDCDWIVTIYCPSYGSMPALIFDLNFNNYQETMRSFHNVAMLYEEVWVLASPTIGMSNYDSGLLGLYYT
jgi:hypothetical protein